MRRLSMFIQTTMLDQVTYTMRLERSSPHSFNIFRYSSPSLPLSGSTNVMLVKRHTWYEYLTIPLCGTGISLSRSALMVVYAPYPYSLW